MVPLIFCFRVLNSYWFVYFLRCYFSVPCWSVLSFFQIVSKCFFVISVVFCLLFPNSSILSYTYLHSLLFLLIICFPFPLLISDSKFFLSSFISLALYQRTCSKKWQALVVENFDSPRPGSGPLRASPSARPAVPLFRHRLPV